MKKLKENKKKVVVIGGGTAGLTIASQLQEFFDVVVIEKSKYRNYPFFFYKIPLLGGLLFNNSKYISKKIIEFNGREIPFFESNLIGGASVINGCVHTVGNELMWNKALSPFNSNYNEVLSSFKKLYSYNPRETQKIIIKETPQNVIDHAFISSLNLKKIPYGDMNNSDMEICGPILVTTGKYFRSSVTSLIKNKQFTVLKNQKVKKVNFDDNSKVISVDTNSNTIKADYVICSSGVIGTCDLLNRSRRYSGKNKQKSLKDISIGHDIVDHSNLRIKIMTNRKFDSLNELSNSFLKKITILVKHFFGKHTLLKTTGASSAAYLDLDKDGIIDTKIQILQFTESGRLGSDGSNNLFDTKPGFSIAITLINPKSKGMIELHNSKPSIVPNYLADENDINLLGLALKYCIKLLSSRPLSDYVLEIIDKDDILSDPKKYIFNNIYSGYHLIGGAHKSVNSDFKVKGTKNLFICDASVFKDHVASNSHASVVLLADIFSKKFIENNFDK